MSDSREQWGPIEGEQEGESGAFRAPKGEKFPTCEPELGHCGSVGAKGQSGSPGQIEMSPIFKDLRALILSNPGNSREFGVELAKPERGRKMGLFPKWRSDILVFNNKFRFLGDFSLLTWAIEPDKGYTVRNCT